MSKCQNLDRLAALIREFVVLLACLATRRTHEKFDSVPSRRIAEPDYVRPQFIRMPRIAHWVICSIANWVDGTDLCSPSYLSFGSEDYPTEYWVMRTDLHPSAVCSVPVTHNNFWNRQLPSARPSKWSCAAAWYWPRPAVNPTARLRNSWLPIVRTC